MLGVIPIAKLAVHVAASVGVSKVVGDIIRNNVTVVTTADAVKVITGRFVIGAIVAESASKLVNARFNEAAEWYAGRKNEETTDEPVEVTASQRISEG